MRADDLQRLNMQANAGSDLASELSGAGDAELRAAILAYRQVADTLARITADRIDTGLRDGPRDPAPASRTTTADPQDPPSPDDPEAAALAARLAEDRGVAVTGALAYLAREALDMTDGDREAAFSLLEARHGHPDTAEPRGQD